MSQTRGKVYIANGFSPAMLSKLPLAVEFSEVSQQEFCEAVNTKEVVNSVGHQGTIDVINGLCGSHLNINRISIKVDAGDTVYIISLLTRLEEGKVLSAEELQKMLAEGKVKFIKAQIYSAVLSELAECGKTKVCDEKYYDYLASSVLSNS